jgi:hypothetical protein
MIKLYHKRVAPTIASEVISHQYISAINWSESLLATLLGMASEKG